MSDQYGFLRGVSVAGIKVRVLKSESHKISSTPTQYPIESGKSVIDHMVLNPNAVQIKCEITNVNAGTEQARLVLIDFNKMRENREPFDLLTEHVSYKNMVLIGLNPVHQAPYKGALVIDLSFHQVGIIGEVQLIARAGGRPNKVLISGGIRATACAAQFSGEQPANTNAALIGQCIGYLKRMSVYTPRLGGIL